MNAADLRKGRTPLNEAAYGVDLSGRDFANILVEAPETLSHSFLEAV
jgi:hypothetical protein